MYLHYNKSGFTLIIVMMLIVVMGILLGSTAQSWHMFSKREREAELLFRGTQYRDAIMRWYNPNLKSSPKGAHPVALADPQKKPLRDMKYLYEGDPSFPNKPRYLRKPYIDPITHEDFGVLKDAAGNIIGVFSKSKEEPIKKGNFPEDLKEFTDKTSYADWQFVYRQIPLAAATQTNLTGIQTGGAKGAETGPASSGTSGSGSGPGNSRTDGFGFGGIMGSSPE